MSYSQSVIVLCLFAFLSDLGLGSSWYAIAAGHPPESSLPSDTEEGKPTRSGADGGGPGAPSSATPEKEPSVPRMIKFSGVLKDAVGKSLTGPVDVNFGIYKEQNDVEPMWQEMHTVQADEQGHYTVLLGAMQAEGLPIELFTSGRARWRGCRALRGQDG